MAWVDADAFGYLDEAAVLEGFGIDGQENGDKGESRLSIAQSAANPRVQALPARYGDDGQPLPAQIAYFLPTVPDTLLLQEAAP